MDASPAPDGGSGLDASEPGSTDAAGEGADSAAMDDGDGDGVSASTDCDDADPTVGATATRGCEHACDPDATQACSDGVWGDCTATTDCACSTEGETRVVDCPRCGWQPQECVSGTWTSSTECVEQGACEVGDVEEEPVEYCGPRRRICREGCTWTEWMWLGGCECDSATPECEPGTVEERDLGNCGLEQRTCQDGCTWTEWTTVREPGCEAGSKECTGPIFYYGCNASCEFFMFEDEAECKAWTP